MYTEGPISILFLFLIPLLGLGRASPEISVVTVEPEQFAPDTQILDKELFLITNITRIVIHCEAHYPVQWEFDGFTSPMQLEVKAIRKSGPKLSDPTFIAQLVVYRVSSPITGTYKCRSVLNPLKQAVIHVFAQEKGYRGQDPVLLKYGQSVDITAEATDSHVKFPCAVWEPNAQIGLYKKSEITGKYEAVKAVNFDPKQGFVLNLKEFAEPWGHYMCTPAINRTFDRVYVNLLPKPGYRVNPSEEVVEVALGESLKLHCESKEDVDWRVSGIKISDSRMVIKPEYKPDSDYPYHSTLTYSDLDATDGGDGVQIGCVNKNGSQELHKWSFQIVGKQDVKRRGIVKYHSRRTNMDCFACWARTSRSPDVSFVKCTNPMECQIRGACLRNANKCDTAFVRICAGGCAIASIENQTGILQCTGDGIFQQIRQFVGVSGTYLYNSVTDAPRDEQLLIGGKHVFKVGTEADFSCTGSSFLFAGGFRWGLKSQGNVITILDPSSEDVVSFEESFLPTGNIVAKAVLKLNSSKITQVNCFAPFWNSTDWDSRTYRVYVQQG